MLKVSGLSDSTSACLTNASLRRSCPLTKTTQYGPKDKLNRFPYCFLSLVVTFSKSPPNKDGMFPINGRGVGPGGQSPGRFDRIHRNVKIRTKNTSVKLNPSNILSNDIEINSSWQFHNIIVLFLQNAPRRECPIAIYIYKCIYIHKEMAHLLFLSLSNTKIFTMQRKEQVQIQIYTKIIPLFIYFCQ